MGKFRLHSGSTQHPTEINSTPKHDFFKTLKETSENPTNNRVRGVIEKPNE
jgi:hypothetical protein